MGDLISQILEFIAGIFKTGSHLGSDSLYGESKYERESRRLTNFIFFGIVLVILFVLFMFWRLTRDI